jgi:hypothetical protein
MPSGIEVEATEISDPSPSSSTSCNDSASTSCDATTQKTSESMTSSPPSTNGGTDNYRVKKEETPESETVHNQLKRKFSRTLSEPVSSENQANSATPKPAQGLLSSPQMHRDRVAPFENEPLIKKETLEPSPPSSPDFSFRYNTGRPNNNVCNDFLEDDEDYEDFEEVEYSL